MSKAGGVKLVHSVRMMLEQRPDFICAKLDFANAFNSVARARIIRELAKHPTLSHLAQHAAIVLAPSNGLESGGRLWGEASEGTTQGDPESGAYFCIAMQEFVVEADRRLAEAGGFARFGWDDGYLLGPPELVYPVLDWFSEQVQLQFGLGIQRVKTNRSTEL